MADIPVDWKSIICREVESEELDYKAAQNWERLSKQSKAKFVRHCMAMANTKGGYIVVGVGEAESGKPCLYTGVTEEQAKSFDPTSVGDFVNRYADPAIDFDIVRPIIDDKQYVVFVIRQFSNIPHVCSRGCDNELQQGAFYIRTAEASSRVAYRASEIHGIVQRALRNQREMLGRMMRGVLYGGSEANPDADSKRYFVEQQEESRQAAARLDSSFRSQNGSFFELSVGPTLFARDKFSLSEIRKAVEESIYTYSGSPFLRHRDMDKSYLTNVSLRLYDDETGQFWQIFQSGLFHFMQLLDTKTKVIDYHDVIRMIAGAIDFIAGFYSVLGYDDEMLNMRFMYSGAEGFRLDGIKSIGKGKKLADYVCRIPIVDVKKKRSAANIFSGVAEHAAEIIAEVCERFNVPRSRHSDLEGSILRFLENRDTTDRIE